MHINKKQIVVTSLGNILEWFDFALFLLLAPIIGAQFFSTNDPSKSTMAALLVFSMGFICRPLGGFLFGHSGDTQGRAKTLRISIIMISISTLLIGLLPSYHVWGIMSSILFVIFRLIHGISIGGEYSGVMIYLAETASSKKRGLITSFAASGANIGFLTATLVILMMKHFFTEQMISEWVWRLPFIFIGLIGTVILYLRFTLAETATFSYLKNTHHLKAWPFVTAIRYAKKSLLKIIALAGMNATLYYVFFGYLSIYLEKYFNINSEIGLSLQSISIFCMLFLVPIAAICGDRMGRKKMMITTTTLMMIFGLACIYLLQLHQPISLLIVYLVATILSSMDQGNSLATVVENCPADIRYSGVSVSYNIGMGLFGGIAPIMLTFLTEKIGTTAPAYYVMGIAAMSFIAALTLKNKTSIQDTLQTVDQNFKDNAHLELA